MSGAWSMSVDKKVYSIYLLYCSKRQQFFSFKLAARNDDDDSIYSANISLCLKRKILCHMHIQLEVSSDHNWLIYGPILVCICLITLCMVYDKIYRCYLSSKVRNTPIVGPNWKEPKKSQIFQNVEAAHSYANAIGY